MSDYKVRISLARLNARRDDLYREIERIEAEIADLEDRGDPE